ncbi:MAG: hypothetical protein H7Z21_01825 [Hymenobacter sp.]|nr:hypothetical protein [Hymenobacter sp.]
MPELTLFNNGPQKQYTKEMKNRFGYYAAWDPGIPCALGDIGVLKNNVFTRLGSLTEQGIPFEALLDTTPVDMDYESRGSVTTTLKASGAATPTGSGLGQLDAGIIIEFSKANAVVFRAQSCLTHQLKDTIRLGAAVLEQFRAGRWDKNWVVITSLVEAKSATIVISKQAQGKIELKATANISAPKLDVADGSFAFAQSFVRGIDTKIIAQAGLTPLFNVMGIKNTLFAPPAFKVQGVDGMSRLTPQLATDDLKDSISFGYITSTPNQ